MSPRAAREWVGGRTSGPPGELRVHDVDLGAFTVHLGSGNSERVRVAPACPEELVEGSTSSVPALTVACVSLYRAALRSVCQRPGSRLGPGTAERLLTLCRTTHFPLAPSPGGFRGRTGALRSGVLSLPSPHLVQTDPRSQGALPEGPGSDQLHEGVVPSPAERLSSLSHPH